MYYDFFLLTSDETFFLLCIYITSTFTRKILLGLYYVAYSSVCLLLLLLLSEHEICIYGIYIIYMSASAASEDDFSRNHRPLY